MLREKCKGRFWPPSLSTGVRHYDVPVVSIDDCDTSADISRSRLEVIPAVTMNHGNTTQCVIQLANYIYKAYMKSRC